MSAPSSRPDLQRGDARIEERRAAAREDEHANVEIRAEAQRELFHQDHEEREVRPDPEADSGSPRRRADAHRADTGV